MKRTLALLMTLTLAFALAACARAPASQSAKPRDKARLRRSAAVWGNGTQNSSAITRQKRFCGWA